MSYSIKGNKRDKLELTNLIYIYIALVKLNVNQKIRIEEFQYIS